MEQSQEEGFFQLPKNYLEKLQKTIALSVSYNDNDTRATIKEYNEEFGYVLCPHSAIGVRAGTPYFLIFPSFFFFFSLYFYFFFLFGIDALNSHLYSTRVNC